MYFTLSKLLPALIMPYSLLFAFLLLLRLLIKKGKIKQAASSLLFLAIVLYLLSLPYLSERHKHAELELWNGYQIPQDTVSVAVILGGFMEPDSIYGYGLGASADRLLAGIRLVKAGKASFLLLSGGVSPLENRPPEADLMTDFIQEFQLLPDSLLIIENHSTSTFENARFSAQILDSLQLSKHVYLCTSVSHMKRATELFKQAGFSPIPIPVDFPQKQRSFDRFPFYLVPSLHSLNYWSSLYREWLGYWFYKIIG
jgi:uncharacterized SAM-binding protein YcdF (DUF218 family)